MTRSCIEFTIKNPRTDPPIENGNAKQYSLTSSLVVSETDTDWNNGVKFGTELFQVASFITLNGFEVYKGMALTEDEQGKLTQVIYKMESDFELSE